MKQNDEATKKMLKAYIEIKKNLSKTVRPNIDSNDKFYTIAEYQDFEIYQTIKSYKPSKYSDQKETIMKKMDEIENQYNFIEWKN